MSSTPPESPPASAPASAALRCPRCGAEVPPEQDWCLECGLAARTVVAPAPRWRLPLILAAVVGALALAAIAVAFVDLTEDPKTVVAPAPTTASAPPAATTPAVPAPGTTAPGTTTPAQTVPPPVAVPEGTGGAAAPEGPTATAPAAPPAPRQP